MTDIDAIHAWRELGRRLRLANEALEPALRTFGATSAADFEALELLGRADGGALPQRRVQEALGLSQSGTSRLTTRLERAGLLRRTTSTTDARAALLHVTDAGRHVVHEHRAVYEQRVREELRSLTAELLGAPEPASPRTLGEDATSSLGGILQFGESMLSLGSGAVTVADAIHVREALEPLMLLEAAQYRTEEDILDCEKILAEMASHLSDGKAFYLADWSLHRRLASICRNNLLRQVYESLLSTLREHVDSVVPTEGLKDYLRRRLVVHTEIIGAIASGRADLVRQAAHDHAITGISTRVDATP
jgi:DNA-binding FadR family transcriptional regulator